jgi:hypothetical protein
VGVFEQLLHDDIWGVRKACAETIAHMSEVVLPATRVTTVTQWCIALTRDQSRWVCT